MVISVRTFLLLGFSFCFLPLSPIADEAKGAGVSLPGVTDPAASGRDNEPGKAPSKGDAAKSKEEAPPKGDAAKPIEEAPPKVDAAKPIEETPPKGGAPAETQNGAPLKSLENFETSTNSLELQDLERQSAIIKTLKADLKEALDLAEMLTLRLDTLDSRTPPQDQISGSLVVSAPSNVADKVHVFIMADTRPVSGRQANPIATGARENAKMMKALLESQCKDASTSSKEDHLAASGVKVLTDGNFSFQTLEQQVTAANVGPNDVLFVYFACHGSTYNDQAKSHFFQTPNPKRNTNEELARSEVWRLMKGKGARQTILISDTCSNATSLTPYSISPLTVAAPATNALSRLLLYQIGDVDISGSTRPPADNGDRSKNGQFGIYNDKGGFFTIAFLSASLGTPVPVSWKKLLDNAQAELTAQMAGGVDVNVFGRIIKLNRQTYELVPD